MKEIPNFTNLYCDKSGNVKVVNKNEKAIIKNYSEFVSPKGYIICRINYKLKNGYKSYIRMKHKLIASALLKDFKQENDVNHIDGNKLNNCINNLESITHAENMKHASKLNLLNNQHNVIVRIDGVISTFPSIVALSNYLNIDKLSLIPRIKYSKICNILIKVNDKIKTVHIKLLKKSRLELSTTSGKPALKCYVYDMVKNKYFIYDSLMECAYETTITVPTLSANLSKGLYVNRFLGYIVSPKPLDKKLMVHNNFTIETRLKNIKTKVDLFNYNLNKI